MTDWQSIADIAQAVEQSAKPARDHYREASYVISAVSALLLLQSRKYQRISQREQTQLLKQLVVKLNMVPIIWKGARYKTLERKDEKKNTVSIDLLIIHGMGGTLSGTTQWFQNLFSFVSAHAGVGESEVHEYVDWHDTAWGAGKWEINLRSFNLEIQNQPLNDTILRNAKEYLISNVIPKVFGDRRPDRSWVRGHNEIIATACPKGISVDAFVADLQAMWDAAHVVAPPEPTVNVPIRVEGRVTSSVGVNVRSEPSTKGTIITSPDRPMRLGQGFWYIEKVTGESIQGNNIWLRLEDNNYCWGGATNVK